MTYLKEYSFNTAHINLLRKQPLPDFYKFVVIYGTTEYKWENIRKKIIALSFKWSSKQNDTEVIKNFICSLLEVIPKTKLNSIKINDIIMVNDE